ncbi:MAG: TetR/AcrR family transcriptional regulator [Muribaculaceae bacterium]|nr:TetR/AcrR family transcriptional regulator [Muribaculaceae bacterium]
MEKGIKSRRRILGIAFRLFASYSYPDVSYSLLEEATGISRGSMVYYFKNKEGIFKAVLETFFYGPDNIEKVHEEEGDSLKRFYNRFVQNVRDNLALLTPYNIPNPSEARFNIERSAAQFIPGFKKQAEESQIRNGKIWKEVIRKSVESGELRSDINIDAMGELFQAITLGFFYMCSKRRPEQGLDFLLHLYDSQYSLIRS